MNGSVNFHNPPLTTNYEGKIRKVGFELEFSGLSLPAAAGIIAHIFGGRVEFVSNFLYLIKETKFGDFTVELDAEVLKEERYKDYLKKIGIDVDRLRISEEVETFISRLAAAVVPHEIILPPIPLMKIPMVETLKNALREAKAQGTKVSLVYAFSLQINPEIPSGSPGNLINYIKSFLLLFHWIYKQSKIDFSRRIAPFITNYPPSYYLLALNPEYCPDLPVLIDDYLAHNPTRNRPLDLLPLFTWLDKDRVWRYPVEKELIKPRPTFHYRLPNSLIDEKEWTVAQEWNLWVEVEKLAFIPEKIRRMSEDFLDTVGFPMSMYISEWTEKVEYWLKKT